jgi:hypothetical protein
MKYIEIAKRKVSGMSLGTVQLGLEYGIANEDAGISPGKLAVACVRDIPGITSLVFGADNPQQVMENAVLFETGPLKGSIRREIEKDFGGIDYSGIMAVLNRTYGRSGQYKRN